MKSLRDIFWSLPKFADKWDPYFDVYETWFAKFRNHSPRILEIGVQNGGSADMWVEYFGPGTRVVGVDIDPRCLQHTSESVEIVIGDQGSTVFWTSFFESHPEPFDIVIDDGSHQMSDMVLTFILASKHVRDGGIYLVEDCHTVYWTDPSIYHGDIATRGIYNPQNFMEFTKAGLDVLNRKHMTDHPQVPQLAAGLIDVFGHIKSTHYYDSMVVYEVGATKPFTRCLNSGARMQAT